MNFLACDGAWQATAEGTPVCLGTLKSLTTEEMQSLTGSAMSWDDVAELQGEAITLFAIVFGFLVLKKLLK